MRGRAPQYRVQLNRKPRQRLEALVRRRTPEHYVVMRAKIVLASANGLSTRRICEAYHWTTRSSVDGSRGTSGSATTV
jgi:hypothetical protein